MKEYDYRHKFIDFKNESRCNQNVEQVHYSVDNKKPNVIWIISDQHRAQAIGVNGDPNVCTPNIDNMAKFGVNFTNAVSGYPLCCPFRGSMLTSRYPNQCVPGHEYNMSKDLPTIADVFNEQGYDTGYFGKWHLDGCRRNPMMHIVPKEHRGGFKTWIGYENNNSQYNTWVHGHRIEEIKPYRLKGYETDELSNMFMEYLKKKANDEQPFFAVLSVQPPHNPYVAPPEFMSKYKATDIKLRPNVPQTIQIENKARKNLAGYYAMIENLDWNIGRIRQLLMDLGLDLNTHIMFFSDHGDMQGSHSRFGKVLPYEESIRIPFIISGAVPTYYGYKTGEVNAPINHVDIAPTSLGLCSITPPSWMQGHDYSYYRVDPDATNPSQFAKDRGDEPESAFIQVIMPREQVNRAWRGVITKDGWKYIAFEGVPWLMYNTNNDPYEQNNLAYQHEYMNKAYELNEILKEWIIKTGDCFEAPYLLR